MKLINFTVAEYREGVRAVREKRVSFLGITLYSSRCTSTDNNAVRTLTEITNNKSNIKIKGFK